MLDELTQDPPNNCLSDLVLDRWRAGELSKAEVRDCELHLQECVACRKRHAELEQDAADFLNRFPQLSERPASTSNVFSLSQHPKFFAGASVGLAMAAAMVLWLQQPSTAPTRTPTLVSAQPNSSMQPQSASGQSTRSKGGSRLGYFIKRGPHIMEGEPDAELYPGDTIRFTVKTDKPLFVAVLSKDAAGVVSVYHPATLSQPAQPALNGALDTSVRLDQTLGLEQVWGVFCERPFSAETLKAQIKADGALNLPEDCSAERLSWRKKPAP